MLKLIFCLQINIKGFFKLILSFRAFVASHAQITLGNKFAISLQCVKKEASDKVDFLHISMKVSYKLILSIDTEDGQALPKFTK